MNTAITKTVYGTLAVLALVAIGLWAQSPDLTITPDEPEVVPEMTLNRAAGRDYTIPAAMPITLPTSDPAIAGAVWSAAGTLKISAG